MNKFGKRLSISLWHLALIVFTVRQKDLIWVDLVTLWSESADWFTSVFLNKATLVYVDQKK